LAAIKGETQVSAEFVSIAMLLLLPALSDAQQAAKCPQAAPLSETQLAELHKGKLPAPRIRQLVVSCGIDFEPSGEVIGRLRSAGMPEVVLGAVRAATGPAATKRRAEPEVPPKPETVVKGTDARVQVQLTALEPAWVLARADGKYLFSATMEANATRTFEASSEVWLRLGNAGAVSIVLNGKAIGPVGPTGQVRTVTLRADGFEIVPPKSDVPPNPEDSSASPPSAVAPPATIVVGTKKVNPKDGLTYVWIPPGRFIMGCSPGDGECGDDEKPAHQVIITKGFWLGQTPVTQKAYQRVTGRNPSSFEGANLPVETVNWDEASGYCAAIGGRLPTEAEWEYAARARSTSAQSGNPDDIAWHSGNSGGKTHEVGLKLPNAFELYDMLGNVWQWVGDWYGNYPPGSQNDPFGTGQQRALRGGSWYNPPRLARASGRIRWDEPSEGAFNLGLRCVAK
jgi:formylglycine-generating enzyme required for sulfatase activity